MSTSPLADRTTKNGSAQRRRVSAVPENSSRKSPGSAERETTRAAQRSNQRPVPNLFRLGHQRRRRCRNRRLPLTGSIQMVRIPTHGPPTHPGAMLLEEFLKPLQLSQTELAKRIGVSYPRVNELVHGRRGVTPDTALRLERLLGMEAQFWMNLQLAWDLYHAQQSKSAKDIRKIKPLRRSAA